MLQADEPQVPGLHGRIQEDPNLAANGVRGLYKGFGGPAMARSVPAHAGCFLGLRDDQVRARVIDLARFSFF